ncbi:MAG: glycosyltransferase family 2 protein [Candidatus Paceibacterota bacterium]|jgi:glycosyltransferase involved in cell wall biosynthesis
MKDFSIIILSYKSVEVIKKNIDSILSQKMPSQNYELILVDDGSRDGTDKVLQLIASTNNNIRVFALKKRHGNGYCKNLAIKMSEGKILFFLDDHLFLPNKNSILMMYDALAKDKSLVGVCGNYISENESDYNLCRDIRRFMIYGKNSQDLYLNPNKFIPFSIVISAIRKDHLNKSRTFPEEFTPNASEDICFQINQHKKMKSFLYLSSVFGYHSHNANFFDAVIKIKRELVGYILILKKFSNDVHFNNWYLPSFFSFPLLFYFTLTIVFLNKYLWPVLFLTILLEILLLYPIAYYKISLKVKIKVFTYCLLNEALKLPAVLYIITRHPSCMFSILRQLFFWEIKKIKYIYENRFKKPWAYKITSS